MRSNSRRRENNSSIRDLRRKIGFSMRPYKEYDKGENRKRNKE